MGDIIMWRMMMTRRRSKRRRRISSFWLKIIKIKYLHTKVVRVENF